MLVTEPPELGAAGWADQLFEVVPELVDPEELEDDELEEEEPVAVLVEAVPLVATADVAAARIAIDPPSPRNVATLRTAARTRDRAAACRRLRRGRGPAGLEAPAAVGRFGVVRSLYVTAALRSPGRGDRAQVSSRALSRP
ncbi:MAG: hypothetical protein M3Q23_04370 [Actinomycetota bacterium]|nr:hypothetical protein [Actinomycetota bacterium]